MEKDPENVVESNGHPEPDDPADGTRVNEAKDIYGDIQTAEEYGYVTRG